MNRAELEKHLGEYVDIKIFDGSVYRGTLRKTGTEEVKNDPNLYLKSNYYFLAHKGTYITNSCLFRVSHIRSLKILKQIAIKIVTDAEGECGAGTGIIKLSEVVAKLYAYLPSVVRILFTEKQLVQIAESVLAEAKKKWEANENLTTYIENKQQTTQAVATLTESTK